ncbi:hypothetical protein ACET3Z_020925 [Daucus carota]
MEPTLEPTLSAATKTAKKKILAERNQAFTFTNSSKPPILDSRTSPARSVRSSCSSDYDEDEENSFDGNTSSKKPYDPFTNYLSPRPKILSYELPRISSSKHLCSIVNCALIEGQEQLSAH